MSTKGRITFTVAGNHPHLDLVRDHLIRCGLAMVPHSEVPDVCVYGACLTSSEDFESKVNRMLVEIRALEDVPVLLLSSGSIYSDRDVVSLKTRNQSPMKEDLGLLVSSPLDTQAYRTLFTLLAEHLVLVRETKTMVLRVFNVYGPNVLEGVVPTFIKQAKQGKPLSIQGNGYQVRTFLYEDDFLDCISRAVYSFHSGARGIYNVGSPEAVTINQLAESVWDFAYGPDSPLQSENVDYDRLRHWWKVPDVARITALVGWKPKTSLRQGLWELLK